MSPRTPDDLALEFYSRGFTSTRQEALDLVNENPDAVTFLLGLPRVDRELRNPLDIAAIDDWGHADTGQGTP